MNLKLQENLKSTTFWVAMAAFVLLMLHTFGVTIVDSKFNEVFNAVLGLLTMLGILNAPQTVPTVTLPLESVTIAPKPLVVPVEVIATVEVPPTDTPIQ